MTSPRAAPLRTALLPVAGLTAALVLAACSNTQPPQPGSAATPSAGATSSAGAGATASSSGGSGGPAAGRPAAPPSRPHTGAAP